MSDALLRLRSLALVGRLVVNEPSPQADNVVLRVAEPTIELDDLSVGRAHLKVELGAAALDEEALGLTHQGSCVGPPAVAGGNGQVVNPATVAIEADHGGRYQFLGYRSDQKQLGLFGEFARDVGMWIIPRARQTALLPERDDGGFIAWLKDSDLHAGGDGRRQGSGAL